MDDGDDTPARLEQVALRCAARWGLAKTGLGDIAKEAGCARQTVYNHFPDARSVIAAALFDASAAFIARLFVGIRAHERAGDRILEAMGFCLRHLRAATAMLEASVFAATAFPNSAGLYVDVATCLALSAA